MPLLIALVAVPLLITIGGLRLACDSGALEGVLCGATDAPIAMTSSDIEISGGETALAVADPGGQPVVVAREPTALFPGQFLKFVVVSPDNNRVLYVTATSLGMTNASLWTVPRGGGAKTLLKAVGDQFWVARPAWCQPNPGDPGRIAYILKGPVGPDQNGLDRGGLELWVIDGAGGGDRRVLVGTPQNGLMPEQFYGDRPIPLRFMNGCRYLRYGDGNERFVVDLDTGQARQPLTVPAPAAPPPTPVPTPGAAAPVSQPCLVRPFAQTDPRWGGDIMRTEGTALRSWGCALTSTAMVFNYYGVDTDPKRLNQCASELADLLYWDPVRARCAAGRIPTATRWTGNASWVELEGYLSKGRPVIVGLQGGPAGSHFLVVTSGAGNSAENYRIVDSWDGSTFKTLADYINPKKGYILKWLVVFEGPTPTCTPVAPAEAGVVTITSPQDGGVYNEPQTIRYSVKAAPGARIEASHPDGATVGDEGLHTVIVTVNTADQVVRKRVNFLIDRTAPSADAAWQPLTDTTVRLDLTASDAQTAVTEAHYRVDGGAWRPVNAATAEALGLDLKPIEVTGLTPGAHRIGYFAIDSAGNRSPESELTVTAAPPIVAIGVDGNPTPVRAAVAVAFPPEVAARTVTVANTTPAPTTITIDRGEPKTWLKVKTSKRKRSAAVAPPPKPRAKKQRPERRARAMAPRPPDRTLAMVGDDGGWRALYARVGASERVELLPDEELLIELELDEDELFEDVQDEEITVRLPSPAGGPAVLLVLKVRADGAPSGPVPVPVESGPVITPGGVIISDRLVPIEPIGRARFTLRGPRGTTTPWRVRRGEEPGWLDLTPRAGSLPADGGPEVVTIIVNPVPESAPPAAPITIEIEIGDPPVTVVPITIVPAPPVITGPGPVGPPPAGPVAPGPSDPNRPSTPTPGGTATPIPGGAATPTPTPRAAGPVEPAITATPTASPSTGATPTITPTPDPNATATPTPDPNATATPTPATRSGATPTITPTRDPNATPTPTPAGGPGASPTVTPNPNAPPTPTPDPNATPTPTPNPNATPTATAVSSPGGSATGTPTPDPNSTPTPTPPPTAGASATPTPAPASAATSTVTPPPATTGPVVATATPTTPPPPPTPTPTVVVAPPTATATSPAPPTPTPAVAPTSPPTRTPTRATTPPPGPPVPGKPTVPPPPDQLDPQEAALLVLINEYRASKGLPPLVLHPNLSAAADWHSHDMARNNYFDHTDSMGRDPYKRMADFGYTAETDKGESIDAARETAAAVFASWKADSYHDENMLLDRFHSIGIGRAYNPNSTFKWYWTVTFGGV